jgi:integrase
MRPRNPLRRVELPPNDEKPRLRVPFAAEAEQLLAALEPEDAVPYAIAFYAGLRRSENHRLEWPDVLDERTIASRLLVTGSKSEAGRERRPPDRGAAPRRAAPRLAAPGPAEHRRRHREIGDVRKLAERATKAWTQAGLNRITLQWLW